MNPFPPKKRRPGGVTCKLQYHHHHQKKKKIYIYIYIYIYISLTTVLPTGFVFDLPEPFSHPLYISSAV
jgi:hypothetical protein